MPDRPRTSTRPRRCVRRDARTAPAAPDRTRTERAASADGAARPRPGWRAVAMGGKLLPERHRATVGHDRLNDTVKRTHGGDAVVGEPAGNPDFLRGGGELAAASDPSYAQP